MATSPPAAGPVTLDDKYLVERGRIYLTGVQALVRLPLMQRQRDAAAGLDTAGFISGYRGSPLGTYDNALVAAREHLAKHRVTFVPGVNEDLAATRCGARSRSTCTTTPPSTACSASGTARARESTARPTR